MARLLLLLSLFLLPVWLSWFPCVAMAGGEARAADDPDGEPTVPLQLELLTGGSLQGLYVDHDDEAVVVVNGRRPFVLAWSELEVSSAYRALRDVLRLRSQGTLTGRDHLALARLGADRGRSDIVRREGMAARRLDRSLGSAVDHLLETSAHRGRLPGTADLEADDDQALPGDAPGSPVEGLKGVVPAPSDGRAETVARIEAVYEGFGTSVRAHICPDLVRLESEHFLVFTDWPEPYRDRITGWLERMYTAMQQRFSLPPGDRVFLARCPVFCWWTRARFDRFASLYDNLDTRNTIGYTRSIAENGHVHMVLLLNGRTQADLDRFIGTLTHEGTHAFVHRLYGTRLIPHWVNEGLAEMVAEDLLGEAYPAEEKAELLARQYARYNWSIGPLLRHDGPIELHQYPLAHSVVRFLSRYDPGGSGSAGGSGVAGGSSRFIAMIRELKAGRSTAEALSSQYGGMTFDALEEAWRGGVRAADSEGALPWKR